MGCNVDAVTASSSASSANDRTAETSERPELQWELPSTMDVPTADLCKDVRRMTEAGYKLPLPVAHAMALRLTRAEATTADLRAEVQRKDAENKRLTKEINEAPHSYFCPSFGSWSSHVGCSCFKSRALSADQPAALPATGGDASTEFVTRGGAHEHRYKNGPLIRWCPASSCTLEEFKRQCEEDSRKLLGIAVPPAPEASAATPPAPQQAGAEAGDIAPGHNPDKLTNEEVETDKGYEIIPPQLLRTADDQFFGTTGWRNVEAEHVGEEGYPTLTYRRRVPAPSEGKGEPTTP